jgi:hypothetical protein
MDTLIHVNKLNSELSMSCFFKPSLKVLASPHNLNNVILHTFMPN